MEKEKIKVKSCPLTLVNSRGGSLCEEEECAIWDKEKRCCALLTFLVQKAKD